MNQPTPSRCYDLGLALHQAIESNPADLRVGVVVSEGLSHFVTDERLDRLLLVALRVGSKQQLRAIYPLLLNAGSLAISCCLTKKGHASCRTVSLSVRPELTCSWFCVYYSDIEIKGWEQEASRERSSTYLVSEEEEQHERSNNSK